MAKLSDSFYNALAALQDSPPRAIEAIHDALKSEDVQQAKAKLLFLTEMKDSNVQRELAKNMDKVRERFPYWWSIFAKSLAVHSTDEEVGRVLACNLEKLVDMYFEYGVNKDLVARDIGTIAARLSSHTSQNIQCMMVNELRALEERVPKIARRVAITLADSPYSDVRYLLKIRSARMDECEF